MPFARGDMRDHIVSHKNDHGASQGRYAVLQWWIRLKISFCEIFGVVRFSTFATQSAHGCPGTCRRTRPGAAKSGHRAARIRALILIKMPAQFGYPSLSSEGSTFAQSRGGACTAIFSFQQMGLSWPSRQ